MQPNSRGEERIHTVVGDPEPTPITLTEFYRRFGVSLSPHYGLGVHNGCDGSKASGLEHISGCTGDCGLPENIQDVAMHESWSDSTFKVGDAYVKLPPDEVADLGLELAEGETYDVHFEVLDIQGWRVVVRDDGYPYAAAPTVFASDVVSFEMHKRWAAEHTTAAHCAGGRALVELSHMSGASSLATRLEAVREELESIRVAVTRLHKEG